MISTDASTPQKFHTAGGFMGDSKKLVPRELFDHAILAIRGQQVLIDSDLAAFYQVSTKVLNQSVKRNNSRFPLDFMFQLTRKKTAKLVTNRDRFSLLKHSSRSPYAFTELGVAMLSSVLNSKRAIKVNIQIMRAFARLRRLLSTHTDFTKKLTASEKKYDSHLRVVFDAIRALMKEPEKPNRKIEFTAKEKRADYAVKPQG
jgi:hypothetical protein